jgi:CNT family concentrative nucleoside transporter
VLGIIAVLLAAYLGSTDRKRIRWRTVAWGLGLQLLFAFCVLRFTYGQQALEWAGGVVKAMLATTYAGTAVLFGPLGVPTGTMGSIFAFQVLPTIIFISAFFAVLYHIGVM